MKKNKIIEEEYSNVYDIAEDFTKKSKAIPFPDYPAYYSEPQRKDFKTAIAYGKALDNWEHKDDEFRKKREEWRTKQAELAEEFKQAIGKNLGVLKHKKFEKMYQIALDNGHSSGLAEVASWCSDLAELLID